MSAAPKKAASKKTTRKPRKPAKADLSERILREDAAVAFADPRACFGPDGAPLAPSELPADIARAVASVECKEATARSGGVTRTWKYSFWSKEKALERLARQLGLTSRDPDKGRKAVVNFVMDLGPGGPEAGQGSRNRREAGDER